MSRRNRNWEQEVLPYVKEELKKFENEGIVPTLRTIFYRLSSPPRNFIQNVQGDYTQLSNLMTKCRKRDIILKRVDLQAMVRDGMLNEHRNILKSRGLLILYRSKRHGLRNENTILTDEDGKEYVLKLDRVLRVDCLADETRGAFIDFIKQYKTPEEYIKRKLDFLKGLPNQYAELIPKWYNQPYYVELWTEKNAMVKTFASILKGLDVRIVYNRGFDSISNAWETYLRIKKAWKDGKKVRILYCGDLDPSGDAMDETIDKFMKICFDVENYKENGLYDFKRIGVLYEHIEKFHLPKNPDLKVLKKLKKDERRKGFMEKYGLKSEDDLFQIEIDALAASEPSEFKKIILDEIKPFYDKEIYDNLLSDVKHSDNQISRQVMKYVKAFIEELSV